MLDDGASDTFVERPLVQSVSFVPASKSNREPVPAIRTSDVPVCRRTIFINKTFFFNDPTIVLKHGSNCFNVGAAHKQNLD